jgi:hypothetical protein
MSYSFQVEAKDGVITPVPTTQPNIAVPDGKFSISGHEDADWLSISVTRNDETGKQIAQASGYGVKH